MGFDWGGVEWVVGLGWSGIGVEHPALSVEASRSSSRTNEG